jgi:hypothetical protein
VAHEPAAEEPSATRDKKRVKHRELP